MLRSRRRPGSRPPTARRLRGAAGVKLLRGAGAAREAAAGRPDSPAVSSAGAARLARPCTARTRAAEWDERGDPERDWWMHTATEDFSSELLRLKSQIPTVNRVMKLGNPEIARRLLMKGANPNLKDSTGFAVIHDVAREGFLDTLQTLLEFEADVNVEDNEGNLPLHLAAREGHVRVVEMLLERGQCKVGHQNKRGATAYDLAKLYKRSAVVKLLEDSSFFPAHMN